MVLADVSLNLETLSVALVVAVVGPVIVSFLNDRQAQAREDRQNKRQDAVAAQAATAAKLLLEEQRLTNTKTDRVAELAASSEQKIEGSLKDLTAGQKQIHTLVNSNMTSAMQDSYDSKASDLASLRELSELRQAQGLPPNAETAVRMTTLTRQMAELKAQLDDRQRAAAAVAVEQAAEPIDQKMLP
jgi:hypothetical protein